MDGFATEAMAAFVGVAGPIAGPLVVLVFGGYSVLLIVRLIAGVGRRV